jgi:F420-non-reducing hydrogenase large subunit
MSVDRAAREFIHKGRVTDGLLNKVEMAFRAYDPCNACATHASGTGSALAITIRSADGRVLRVIES